MSPRSVQGRRTAQVAALAAVLALARPGEAGAVVGGREGETPLARSTATVLKAGGAMCSGVVLAPDIVLTAAHCVGAPAAVRVYWKSGSGEPILVEPAAVRRHPGFVADAVASRRRSVDLALVRLPAPLPATFSPATLSEATPAKAAPLALAGYGVAREGDPRSTGTFRTAALAAVEPYGPSRLLLWASGAPGTGACEGDSGGPIADGTGAVVAVTSWAAGRGKRGCGDVSQGVLVGPQRDWIDGALREWGREAGWR